MSADHALTRAQERMNSKIDVAVNAGITGQLQKKSMNVTLKLASGSSVRLVSSDGVPTREGTHYYSKLGIDPPAIFPYEQGLLNGKYVVGFDGKKKLVRRMGADGLQVTPMGVNYFKYNRDSYKVEFPTRLARPASNAKGKRTGWVLDKETFEYTSRDPEEGKSFTVGKLKAQARPLPRRPPLPLLATDAEREQHVRDAANAWIRQQKKITAKDPLTGEEGEYHVVLYDSPMWYVWDETRPIRISRQREHTYDRSNPTTDDILQRPLRNFFVIPDGCYRPWDLHPRSLVKNGRCAVTMLHTCFVKRGQKRVHENGRDIRKSYYTYAMTEPEIERDLDDIFTELGYVEGEYPFGHHWRTDGCTSKMILAFCRKHAIICHVMHGSMKGGKEVECHVPTAVVSHTPRVDFFVRDDHCFWYGKDVQQMGFDKKPAAANGISQMWGEPKREEGSDQEDFAEFACKQTLPAFAYASRVPPFKEWKPAYELLQAAPKFQAFAADSKRKARDDTALYFYHTSLEIVAGLLRKHQEEGGNFSIEMKYGKSPDIGDLLIVKAEACPEFRVKKVPQKCELYQAIFEKATEMWNLAKDKQLVYKGEFPSQVCERLRLEVSKPTRHKWTQKERESVRIRQGELCECGATLEAGKFHLDHVVPLFDGGGDSLDNITAKCLACHGEKSETERLGAIYRNSLSSELSRDVLEGFYNAPRPQQLVLGDGAEDCAVIDAIRCRSNALLKGDDPLPVASIVDKFEEWDSDKPDYKADFYYIDAGEPLDDVLEALPYMGPNWYHRGNAHRIICDGYAKGVNGPRRVDPSHDIVMTFTASHHEPADALVKPYEEIENIVSKTLEERKIRPSLDEKEREYTEDEIRKEMKFLILAMQGSWTSQHSYSWKCVDSAYEEHAAGAVHMWRPNPNGTNHLMTRTETLCNRTMFLIGRIPLDVEHLLIWQLYKQLKSIPRAPTIHGCINDCLFVKGAMQEELEKICADLTWNTDDSPAFKLKDELGDAPLLEWQYSYSPPKFSSLRRKEVTEDVVGMANDIEDLVEKGSFYNFGHWSLNGGFKCFRQWRTIEEEEGLGSCDENDTFQTEMADLLVENRGGYVSGRGGTGKSWMLKLLKPKFEKLGYNVHYIAFTHVAAANLEGNTILYELHRYAQKKRLVVIVDECSMVPLCMWAALANLAFVGNIIIPAGDMDGQFLPIQDQHRMHLLKDLDKSDFMHDLCNGLHITLNKFRRREQDPETQIYKPGDYGHFQFVSQLYPKYNVPLETARTLARIQYEARGSIFTGTTLCVTHRCRIHVNAEANNALARTDSVFVPAVYRDSNDANQPQDMKVWEGIVLMARCGSNEKHLKNGVRYKVVEITDEGEEGHCFELRRVKDQGEVVGESFMMSKEELGSKMRLTHAVTYFSTQARTIVGGLRLAQTSSRLFTLRHLIVGLGRAPIGANVQVE